MTDIYNLVLAAYIIILVSVCVLAVVVSAVIAIRELSPKKENHDSDEK